MKRNLLFTFVLLSALAFLPACALAPETYSAEPIEAWLVDAETKQPIEGAVIVAHWELIGGLHPDRVGDLVILETVSAKNGRFHFPAWGPITHWGTGSLMYHDPELIIFKSGYEVRRLINPMTGEAIEGRIGPVRRSQWNEKTIRMKPYKGAVEGKSLLRNFEALNSSIESIVRGDSRSDVCDWKKIPKMLLAIRKERIQLVEAGITGGPFGISSIDQFLLTNSDRFSKCGSPKTFFESN